MNASKAVYAVLSADAGVAALVGSRIFARVAAQGTARPFLTYQEVDAVLFPVLEQGQPKQWQSRIQVTCVGDDYATVKSVLAAAAAALGGQRRGGSG